MKVSFDFDGTLDRPVVQEYASELILKGFEVWIVTSRLSDEQAPSPNWNKDLWLIAEQLNIPKERIHFTCYTDKSEFFKDKDFLFHLDDDFIEVNLINKHTKTKGISVFGQTNWKNKCNRIINGNKNKKNSGIY